MTWKSCTITVGKILMSSLAGVRNIYRPHSLLTVLWKELDLKRMILSMSEAPDHKKWKTVVRGVKLDSGEGSTACELSVL